MHRAPLEAVFKNRAIRQEGVQAWVNFQRPATCDGLVETIKGLTVRWPETARLKGRLQGPMP